MWRRPGRGALVALLFAPLLLAADGLHDAPRDEGLPGSAPFSLGLADKAWLLWVDLPGFQMEPIQRLAGGARARGSRESDGLAVSLTLATSPGDPSARSCRDHDWAGRQKGVGDRVDTRLSERGDRARVDFTVPQHEGESLREKHVLLYLQRDGVCVVIHLSKQGLQATDDAALEMVLDTVRLGS